MNLSREQLIVFSEGMSELANRASIEEAITNKSIHVTNNVIIFFTLLGAILAISISIFFFNLKGTIDKSITSMNHIEQQIAHLSDTIDDVSSSVTGMVFSLDVLPAIDVNVDHLGQSTKKINRYIAEMETQTRQVAFDAGYVRYHTFQINQRFTNINNVVGHITYSVNESAKPLRQFFPLP